MKFWSVPGSSWLWVLVLVSGFICGLARPVQDGDCVTEPAHSSEAAPMKCRMLRSGLDLALLADSTRSIGSANFTLLKEFLKNIVRDVKVSSRRTHVGLITFHEKATVHDTFKQARSCSEAALLELIGNLSANRDLGERTFIDRALEAANTTLFSAEGGDRSGVPNALVLLTDGRTNKQSKAYKEIIRRLRDKAVHIVAVGIGKRVDETELEKIAGEGNVLMVDTFRQLAQNLTELETMTCGHIVINGGYSKWSSWSDCSKTCDGGEKFRTRTCTAPSPRGSGKNCSDLGPREQKVACNDFLCPVMNDAMIFDDPLWNLEEDSAEAAYGQY